MTGPRDPPYPELKKTHTMARTGRPWTDHRPPSSAPVWAVIEGLASYHVLLAALDLDLFDTLATGPATAGAVAARLDVSEPHVASLLDSVVALGLIDQVRGTYRLNETAERYLTSNGPATMADLVPVAPGPAQNWTGLADTIRRGRPATPIDDDPGPFYTSLAGGTFTTMWRGATRADHKIRYSALRQPRVLDLGAGGAPWSIAVLERCDDGSAVINDLPDVIDVARRRTEAHGVADRCELRAGDYHEIPVEDDHYDLVVLGHVCRLEGSDGARHLVSRAFSALRPEGRVILADYFVDADRKRNPHAVLMGMTMMTSTRHGGPVSHEQAATWLREGGFEALRLIEPIGFQFAFVAAKPRSNR